MTACRAAAFGPHPFQDTEIALEKLDEIERFGNDIKAFEANGPDPNTLPPAEEDGSIPDFFVLRSPPFVVKPPPWECYFFRDPVGLPKVGPTGTGVFICSHANKPENLRKALKGARDHAASETI